MLGMFHYCIVFMAPEILVQFFFQNIINSSRIGKSCNKHGIIMDTFSFFPPWPFLDDFLEISLEQHCANYHVSVFSLYSSLEGGEREERMAASEHPFLEQSIIFFSFSRFVPLSSQFLVVLRQLDGLRLLVFLLQLLQVPAVHPDLWRQQGGDGHELQRRVTHQLLGQPQEGPLKVVVGLGGDVVVLQVLLAVEGDCLGLDLAVPDIDLVAGEDNGDVAADTD